MAQASQPVTEAVSAIKAGSEFRGIPAAEFVDNIDTFLERKKVSLEDALKDQSILMSKYKFMENHLVTQKRQVLTKLPDLETALEAVNNMTKKKADGEAVDLHFPLHDGLYAEATLPLDEDRVFIWLGANVFLEYSLSEAAALLTKSIKNSNEVLASTEKDLSFLKDQITTSEVNYARLHNHSVALKRKVQAAAALSAPASS